MAITMCCPRHRPDARAYNAALIACAAFNEVTLSQISVRYIDGTPVTGSVCTDAKPEAA